MIHTITGKPPDLIGGFSVVKNKTIILNGGCFGNIYFKNWALFVILAGSHS
jgi:hypothetical protein